MASTPYTELIPLEKDDDGMIRVGGTRVTLQTLVYAFRRGDTPEQMVDSFSVLRLADIYAVITYYLNHCDEVDAYVREQEGIAAAIRQENEARFPSDGLRAHLLARMEEKRRKHPESGCPPGEILRIGDESINLMCRTVYGYGDMFGRKSHRCYWFLVVGLKEKYNRLNYSMR